MCALHRLSLISVYALRIQPEVSPVPHVKKTQDTGTLLSYETKLRAPQTPREVMGEPPPNSAFHNVF